MSVSLKGESRPNIFKLLSDYHRSLDNMRTWLETSDLNPDERIGIADAWQSEMRDYFTQNGYCFVCNRQTERCLCDETSQVPSGRS